MKRRDLLASTTALLSTPLLAPLPAWAESDKLLRILVGFPAGVSIDVVTRIIAEKLKEELPDRTTIVDNRGGAGGRLAAELLKNARPDGGTVMVTPVVVPVLAPMVFRKLSYEPKKDFVPVSRLVDFGFALSVPAASPAKTLKEYVEWVKANPNQASFGSPAAGSLPHFFGIMIGHSIGVDMTHVPFNGGPELQTAVIGNHIPAGIDVVSEWQENARAGKVRILATSGEQRSKVLPDVPTFKELGYPDIVGQGWFGMYAPARTPAAQVDAINGAVNKVLALPDVQRKLLAMGYEVHGGTPSQLAKDMEADSRRWGPVVQRSGFRVD